MAMVGRSLLTRIHQPVEQMDDAGAGGATHRYGIAAQISLCDSGENSVFFMLT